MDRSERDEYYMRLALQRAHAAARGGEAPIGAVVVRDGTVLSSGRNMREQRRNALLHAELVAIGRACRKIGAWRLNGCELFVTLEPCPMCAGAIINSRISRVVYGCRDPKAGAYGSVVDLQQYAFNHYYTVEGGVLEAECAAILREFFAALRQDKRRARENA